MASLTRTVALVGMMGAGKSSIGRRLAARLDVPFRDGERRVILRVLKEPPHVLATGGGALLNADTRSRIAEQTFSIWLRAPIELLLSRIERRDTRPLLRNGHPRETLERLLHEREPLYAEAKLVIDAQDGPHHLAVERIVKVLISEGLLQT